MKKKCLQYLACPACKGSFELEADETLEIAYDKAFVQESETGIDFELIENIVRGSLSCSKCEVEYSIKNGIPNLTRKLNSDPEFQSIQDDNVTNYSFQWRVFSHNYTKWSDIYFKDYIDLPASYFKSKLGLDVGCGMGRYSTPPVLVGAELVAVEPSQAVEKAYLKSLTIPGLHVIQADVYNLPLLDEKFDFVQSLGVVHHLPDPEKGVSSLKDKVKPGGKLLLYIYQSFKDDNPLKHFVLKFINLIRFFTSKLDRRLLYFLLIPFIPIVYLLCYFPSLVLSKLGLEKLSCIFPYNYEQYKGRKLRDFHMNLYDRFANPVERRYDKKELKDLLFQGGISKYTCSSRYGWNVIAEL